MNESENDTLVYLASLEKSKLANALSVNYLNVYLIDPSHNRASIAKLDGYMTGGIEDTNGKCFDYTNMLLSYAKERVYQDDLDVFLNTLLPENLLKSFQDGKTQIEIPYRILEKNEIHYYSAHYIRVSEKGQPLILVAGFRIVDNIVMDTAKRLESDLFKAYKALSSLYLSMHRIDVINDTFTEVKSTMDIRQNQIVPIKYSENVNNIMRMTCTPAFLDSILSFVNIKTLPARMDGRNSISMEFLGRINGWCKAIFMKEDEDEKGNLWHVLFAVEVIDESKKKENLLRHLAERDSMTGIYNRGSGVKKIESLMGNHIPGLLAICDCDHFKSINDNYGHITGDNVIIEVARALENALPENSVLMRLGGDEFSFYVPNITDEEKATQVWKEITCAVEDIHIRELGNRKIYVSCGASFYHNEKNVDFNTLYNKADDAMYKSKQTEGFALTID
jgi:diguanylate cyclase (GGDEF)-like protein